MVLPNDEELHGANSSEALVEPADSTLEPPPPPVKRKRRSVFWPLFSALLLLAVVGGGALYAAITFKDRDERLKAVADYSEPYVDQASGALSALTGHVRSLLGQNASRSTSEQAEAPAAAEPNDTAAATATAEAQSSPQSPAPSAEPARAPEPELATRAALESQNAVIESQKAAIAALEARVESAEDAAQRALHAAQSAETAANALRTAAETSPTASPAPTAPAENVERGALTASEQVTALGGRIDELGDEMKALRERLNAPKGETPAAPEAATLGGRLDQLDGEVKALRERLDAPKGETRAAPEATAAKTPDGPAAVVVVAYALQRELEAGRPYVLETTALTRLGADSAALAALTPFAEKGAPTAAQLKAEFAPAAKRIRALENGDAGDLAGHLMKGASKLVRVRPSGQAPTTEAQTVDEKVSHIETALAHGDIARAGDVFATLPEPALNEAKDFGATLRARVDAARAADDLLHGAIAALGATKE